MPATSEARIRANQANAAKSTGPRTAEGKAKSRQNGLKHGLSGRGIVLPEGDAPEVERLAEKLVGELRPKSSTGLALIGQIALLSFRMERAGCHELAASASRVRHAVETFDHERVDRVEALFDAIADEPRRQVRLLKRMPEGVDRLLEAWGELRGCLAGLDQPIWHAAHQTLATHMLGFRPGQFGARDVEALSKAARGEGTLTDAAWVALDPPARRAWALDRLLALIDEQVALLEDHRENLDLEAIELDRGQAPDRALFDPSKDATLARRYEAEARRMFFRSLNEFRRAEAEFADAPSRPTLPQHQSIPIPASMPAPEPSRPTASLGSCRESTAPMPRPVEPARPAVPSSIFGRPDGHARGLDGRVLAIGRPSGTGG